MSGLYIHIPFCHSKCAYCDFFSTPRAFDIDGYIDALHREYTLRCLETGSEPPQTIYIGGGTPSILSPARLERLLRPFDLTASRETTIEVNPEDVTDNFAAAINALGINRVSMGVQSLNDSELTAIGRRHSGDDVLRAVDILRRAGISNLSLDLIFGLPGQDFASWTDSLSRILDLRPQHLSAYSLMYEPGTRLWAQLQAGKLKEAPQEVSEQMYDILCQLTAQAGLEHYEISNFAMPGHRSRHNSSYWNLTPYLGLGVSAHSFDGTVRRHNPADIRRYIASPTPIFIEESLTNAERIDEYLLIRLRTAEGIDPADFISRFGRPAYDPLLDRARRQPMLSVTADRIAIPPRHWLISDSILVDLFE